MEILGRILGYLIEFCYNILHNYGLAIVMFTLLTKVILFPLSIWVHKNSIKMVKMMPEINDLKAKYFGDKDTIAEETQKLYKREKYHPLASTVPMIIQLVLLMGVVDAVKLLLGNSDSVLTLIPIQEGGATLLMPLAAGFAALLLTLAQNRISPLQREPGQGGTIDYWRDFCRDLPFPGHHCSPWDGYLLDQQQFVLDFAAIGTQLAD